MFSGLGPCANFQFQVFEYQLIASEILAQPSRYERAESNLLADENNPLNWNYVIVWVIYLYLYIYWLDFVVKILLRYSCMLSYLFIFLCHLKSLKKKKFWFYDKTVGAILGNIGFLQCS